MRKESQFFIILSTTVHKTTQSPIYSYYNSTQSLLTKLHQPIIREIVKIHTGHHLQFPC
jgi:hypothetical protein